MSEIKRTAQYLTLHINPTFLVFNIETSRELINVPETTKTENRITSILENLKIKHKSQKRAIKNTHALVAA